MKCFSVIILSVYLTTDYVVSQKGKCDRCVTIEECPLFKELSSREQRDMLRNFPCNNHDYGNAPYGFAEVAKGDYVCCPGENVWGIEDSKKSSNLQSQDRQTSYDSNHQSSGIDKEYDNYQFNQNNGDEYEKNRSPNHRNYQRYNNNNYDRYNPNQPMNQYQNSARQTQYPDYNRPNNYPNNYDNNFGNQQNARRPNGNFPNYNQPNGNQPNYNYPNNNYQNVNNYGGGQCNDVIRFAPSPESGCCGRDVSSEHGGAQNGYMNRPAENPNNGWGPRGRSRFSRSADNSTVEVSIDNRIIGGRETELEQFPWTVLLKTTFSYGDKDSAFTCGGSLISSRYVLTAAHCIYEEGARVKEVELNLAEYDKRTFPRDCVNVPGEGQKCIENIVMKAERIIPHPQYDDNKLQNDIALIKIRGSAPYTDFTRPICLPPLNIDNPAFSDLRLAVAGWGRNGNYTSQVKQSTVVNLVPQRECITAYPNLSNKHLCAAGHSGEDTCKGDSGGPLMMLYKGTYYVSGVVSGKRSDSPCGTSVPSLYTNVYNYIDWIKSNIRN